VIAKQHRFSVPFSLRSSIPNSKRSALARAAAIRIVTVLIAAAILYLRMPSTFTNPQFWGEDVDFFAMVRSNGWATLATTMAGYLVFAQFLVANIASYFSPIVAPTIYNYTALLLTLTIVWLVTSPRLEMPNRPLLAIAVVIVPMGYEELGTITNIQWILPIGAFVLMFMRSSPSAIALAGEVALVAVTALSGPFSIFLTPLFFWRLITGRDAPDRRRLVVLTGVMGLGALVQVLIVSSHPYATYGLEPSPYSWTLWINLPLSKVMTNFGSAALLFNGIPGVVLGAVCVTAAVALSVLRPYRMQKIFMLLFATLIAAGGMYKYRYALESQVAGQRYFYAGSVFSLWFICCISAGPRLRIALAACVAAAELALLPAIAETPRIRDDLQWPVWARYISSGIPIIIPTSPGGFHLGVSAANNGPLARFASWIGRDIRQLVDLTGASACSGILGVIEPVVVTNPQSVPNIENLWTVKGSVQTNSQNNKVQIIVLVDSAEKVIGYGLLGFENKKSFSSLSLRSEWTSIFHAVPGTKMSSYGILHDGKSACLLENVRYIPSAIESLTSERFLGAVEMLPGKGLIQRFKSFQRLVGVSVRLVSYGRRPSNYSIAWRVRASTNIEIFELGAGTIDASTVGDWQIIGLPLSTFPKEVPNEVEVSFLAGTDVAPALPVGFPLYLPVADTTAPSAEIGGVPVANGGQLDLHLSYIP